jgi:hypothetical protein
MRAGMLVLSSVEAAYFTHDCLRFPSLLH